MNVYDIITAYGATVARFDAVSHEASEAGFVAYCVANSLDTKEHFYLLAYSK